MHLLAARAGLYQLDGGSAHASLRAALQVTEELQRSARDHWVQQRDRGRLPAPPVEVVLGRASEPYDDLMVRGLLARANLRASLDGDARAAAQDVFDVGAFQAFDGTRWLASALDQARRGRRGWGRTLSGLRGKQPVAAL